MRRDATLLQTHFEERPIVMSTFFDDFAKIRHLPAFVDKSLLIKAVVTNAEGIMLIAPRKFGKTVNLTMMKRFFERNIDPEAVKANRELFVGLEIEKYESIVNEHFGKYPIIYLDFKSPRPVSSCRSVLRLFSSVVHETYEKHAYLVSSDKLHVSERDFVRKWCNKDQSKLIIDEEKIYDAVENLAKFLVKHFEKNVFILVDEYDSICSTFTRKMDGYEYKKLEDRREVKEIINLFSGLMSCLTKRNNHVERIILTGVSYLMTFGLINLNNILVFRFQEDHSFSEYYGLSHAELRVLLKKLDYESEYDNLINYYTGYRNEMLNPWSIMNSLNIRCKLKNYWKQSGTLAKLDEAFRVVKIRSMVTKLLTNISNSIRIRYFDVIEYTHLNDLISTLQGANSSKQDVDIFWNSLLEQGYFSIVNLYEQDGVVEVGIPNQEVRLEFIEKLELFYQRVYEINFDVLRECSSVFDQLAHSTDENNEYMEKWCENLNNLFRSSKVDIIDEILFYQIVFLVAIYSKSKVYAQVQCLKTELDLLVMNCNKVGIIIQLNYGSVTGTLNDHYFMEPIKDARVSLYKILQNKYQYAFGNNKYNPNNEETEYCVLIGLHMSEDKRISLNVLFNSDSIDDDFQYT